MPIRIALVGCGYITQAEHVPALLTALPEVMVVATVDPDAARAEAVARPFGAASFASLAAALAATPACDAVLIATPAPTHLALVREAAQAGCHILLEKPLAYSHAEAVEAIRCIEAAGVRCMMGYHRRHDDDCLEVKRLIESGALGRPRAAISQCRLAYPSVYRAYAPVPSGGAGRAPAAPQDLAHDWLTENSIHHLNLLRFWLGEPTAVHAATYATPRHELGAVTLSFGETLVTHHQLKGLECGETISLYGEAGAIHLDLAYPHRPYAAPRLVVFDRAEGARRDMLRRRGNPYTNQLLHFLKLVDGAAENPAPPDDALRDIELLVRIRAVASYTGAQG